MKREPSVLAFALVFPCVMAWLYFVVVSPPIDGAAPANPAMQVLYALGKVIQFGLPIAYVALFERTSLRFLWPDTAGIRAGIVTGLAIALFAFALYSNILAGSEFLSDTPARIRAKLSEFDLATPVRYAVLAGFLAIVNSFLEEYYWRWFVFGRLRNYVSFGPAIVLSALAFMAHHVIVLFVYFPGRFWIAVVPFSLAIAFGGMIWAWLYHKSGSIVGPWVSHLIVDVAIMAIGYDLAFGR